MARRVSANRVGINRDVRTRSVRGLRGRFTRAYRGNYKNSSEMRAAKQTASRFGTRNQRYRDVRAAFGLSNG
ncbi:hypothetical protein [Hoylesella shahii]|uniref:Uncharacterized protein n=1 Tax=Hoylesella shahii DSM 15611 = JCM 12083 TaxID=1122991 RepID=A0A318I2K5_9BACT|nr:hypothetical protein [Hoylesella shahii]PXX23596.1 hypothetical protein EJ73_00585 [Hoylesella shahii DSM 15611 = JCM 12083]